MAISLEHIGIELKQPWHPPLPKDLTKSSANHKCALDAVSRVSKILKTTEASFQAVQAILEAAKEAIRAAREARSSARNRRRTKHKDNPGAVEVKSNVSVGFHSVKINLSRLIQKIHPLS